jgi:hypothetical protein
MAKPPIIDLATLTRLRSELHLAQTTGNILDRVVEVERALAAVLDALEVAK